MLFVCYPKCSTCRKARNWLDENNAQYTERHIVEDNPSFDELKEWHDKSGLPLKRFFYTKKMTNAFIIFLINFLENNDKVLKFICNIIAMNKNNSMRFNKNG